MVEEAVVENILVVVAFVEVELRAVKFWRVEELVITRLPKAAAAPRKEVAEIVGAPIADPALISLVEWKLVVVAEVPVARTKVKFWRVEELVRRSVVNVVPAEKLLVPEKVLESERRVEDAEEPPPPPQPVHDPTVRVRKLAVPPENEPPTTVGLLMVASLNVPLFLRSSKALERLSASASACRVIVERV